MATTKTTPRRKSAGQTRGAGRKTTATKGARRYGEKAGEKVEETMHEMKRGTLRSGSGKQVTNRKQAIAIGLSKARRAGGKVPPKSESTTKSQSKSKS